MEASESVLHQLNILPFFDPNVHHALELLNDHVLLQAGDRGTFQCPMISLLAELPDKFFFMSVLLPGLHYDVGPVKVNNSTSFSLPLALIVSLKHFVQVPLLAQDKHLIIVNLKKLLLQCELTHRGISTAQDA